MSNLIEILRSGVRNDGYDFYTDEADKAMLRAADEIERLRAALTFYADRDNWNNDVDGLGPLLPRDGGKLARKELLEQLAGEKK